MRTSIIIAAHNEGDLLWRTVRSCQETCAGLDYEIIVADDESTDVSIEEMTARFPRVRVVRHESSDPDAPSVRVTSLLEQPGFTLPERMGTSPTKDLGAREARGDVLVFLDGHCNPEPGAIARLAEDVERVGGRGVVTPTVAALDVRRWQNSPSQLGHGYFLNLVQFHCGWLPLAELKRVDVRGRRFYESPALIGCTLAVHRELYEHLRGFDPHMRIWGVEDLDFGLKCWLMGFPILHDPVAEIGHRFRKRFDNFDVPMEHLIVNQLRMARKNFTEGVWAEWVERCRQRHGGRLAEHPEGLFARAWSLFESRQASAEFERSYLLSRRVRDEFWYAERFGLTWPRLGTPFTPMAEFAPLGGSPSPSPSPPPPPPEPDPIPACETCPCPDDAIGGSSPGIGGFGGGGCCTGGRCTRRSGGGLGRGPISAFPVRYFNGEVQLAASDLSAGGYGGLLEQRRVYSNKLSYNGDVGNGFNWLVEPWPYLVEHVDGSIAFVRGTKYALWFDLVGGSYVARYGARSTLTHDTNTNLFTLSQLRGEQWTFHDFTQTASPQGLFASHVAPGGQTTEATAYTVDERIEALERSVTQGGVTTTEQFAYAYATSGRVQSVTLRKRVGAGSWSDIRRVLYTYYGDADANGSVGDLKWVRVQLFDTSWQDIDQSHYRYWKSGDPKGFAHGLKFAVEPEAYARMEADGLDPLTASNAQIALYADHYFEYDADQRVTKEIALGGSLTFTFAYTQSGNAAAYNNWAVKTVETLPDGNTVTVYTNHIGQVLLKELASGTDRWREYHKYDGDAHEVLMAEPSAIMGYDDTQPDLDVTLKASDGLIHVTDYYTTTGSGAAKGYVQFQKIKRGSTGTEIKLRAFQYASRSAGGVTVHPVSKQTAYRNDDGTGAIDTSFSYTWHSGTVQPEEVVTTLPAVPTSQNGSGTAATRRDWFDAHGYMTWQMNERGFITNLSYDVPTGAITQRIDDVDTGQVSGAPSGWTTPSGGGLNLVTNYEHDDLGRTTQELGPEHTIDVSGTATVVRRATWTVYQDVAHEVRTGQGYQKVSDSSFTLINPVSIVTRDARGNVLEQAQATRASTSGKLQPSDTFAQSSYVRWTTQQYTECCLVSSMRVYHTIPASGSGTEGTNYDETEYGYDSMKRRNQTVSPGGTITFDVFDARGLAVETWVGTNDDGATESDPSGGGADPDNNMVIVTANEYDGGSDGGDGNLTEQTQHVDGSTTRVTAFVYDWRDRQVDINGELDFFQRSYYDNLDRVVKVERYDTTSSGNLVARSETKIDDRGRVYRTVRWGVDPSTGTVGNSLTDNFWFDVAGNEIKRLPAGAKLFTKTVNDSLNRPTTRYVGYDIDETSYSDAVSVAGDTMLEQMETAYDDASNAIQTTLRQRYHDAPASQTGELKNPGETPKARVTYVAVYPDALGRQTAVANYGTNGGSALSRPSTVPTRSDTVLVTTAEYNSSGEAFKTIDPAAREDRTEHDDAGRRTKLIENYVDGNPATGAADEDRTTQWTYTPDGAQKTIKANNSDTGDQTTTYTYGTTLSDSGVARSDLLRAEEYPDSASGSDRIEHKYNRQTERTETKDQNGTVHAFDYDDLARPTHDRVTTLGSGVDGAVRRIGTTYEVRGLPEKITSYDDATVGQGNVVNEVQFAYNDFGQVTNDYQSHSGAVNTSTTPKVQYAYADGSDNTIRATSLTYPDGREVTYDYGTTDGMNDAARRVESLIDSDAGSTHLADYSFVGLGVFVVTDYTEPDVKWTLVDLSGNNDPDTGDIYSGLDRFGRVKDNRWYDYGSSADVDRIKYGYDRASNRLWRENVVARSLSKEFDDLYSYDGLYRLKEMQRGTLNSGHTALTSKTFAQDWALDPTTNWSDFRQDDNGNGTWDLDQQRTANKVNEITDISETSGPSWVTPVYSAAGNITTVPQPDDPTGSFTATYDAWNRMVKLVDGTDTVQENEYDARRFRVVRKDYASGSLDATNHLYLTEDWQVVEVRVDTGTDAERQFVWGRRYVDDIIERDRDTSDNGTLDERLYGLHDVGWSVTTFIDDGATIAERFAYTPYGKSTVLDSNFSPVSGGASSFEWEYRFTGREFDLNTALQYFRARMYHENLGCFLRRDPSGYRDGASLYATYFVPNGTDPTGRLTVEPRGRNLTRVRCGQEAYLSWDFLIDLVVDPSRPNVLGAPCDGYVVQQVDVSCNRSSCDGTTGCHDNFTYWEAWPVRRGQRLSRVRKGGRGGGNDTARSTAINNTCGEYHQYGEVRFYCNPDAGDLLDNDTVVWEPGSTTNPIGYGNNDCCRTTPGVLPSTGQEPGFWSNTPDDGPAERSFFGSWSCCQGVFSAPYWDGDPK